MVIWKVSNQYYVLNPEKGKMHKKNEINSILFMYVY